MFFVAYKVGFICLFFVYLSIFSGCLIALLGGVGRAIVSSVK